MSFSWPDRRHSKVALGVHVLDNPGDMKMVDFTTGLSFCHMAQLT